MRLLLVFLKEPTPGKVKTRLAADLGDEEAARCYKALVEVLLRQLQGLNDCRIRFCYAPDDAGDAIRFWILPEMNATSGSAEGLYLAPASPSGIGTATQEVDFHTQGDGDLGDRMQRAFERGFEEGFQQISVIGSDCPDCGARWINAAFSRLSNSSHRHAVIGPSTDGGYYLLGLNSPTPAIFQDIPWSADDVLEATLTAARGAGVNIEQLPSLSDVDHLSDWKHILTTPLGAALKKALGEELDDDLLNFPQ